MKNMRLIGMSTLALSCFSFFFVGCGGSSSGSNETVLTGAFIDAPVQGLHYSTASQSGITDENGNFKYKDGETITFNIGNLTLGSAIASKTMTPLELGGDTHLDAIGTKSTNIARVLQSLDDIPADSSKIVLPSALQNLSLSNINLDNEADLNTILAKAQTITSKAYVLTTPLFAKSELGSFLSNYIYPGNYAGTSTHNTLSSKFSSAACGGATVAWDVNIDPSLVLSGNAKSFNETLSGIQFNGSQFIGKSSSGFNWDIKISTQGIITGSYRSPNAECVGTIYGRKK